MGIFGLTLPCDSTWPFGPRWGFLCSQRAAALLQFWAPFELSRLGYNACIFFQSTPQTLDCTETFTVVLIVFSNRVRTLRTSFLLFSKSSLWPFILYGEHLQCRWIQTLSRLKMCSKMLIFMDCLCEKWEQNVAVWKGETFNLKCQVKQP